MAAANQALTVRGSRAFAFPSNTGLQPRGASPGASPALVTKLKNDVEAWKLKHARALSTMKRVSQRVQSDAWDLSRPLAGGVGAFAAGAIRGAMLTLQGGEVREWKIAGWIPVDVLVMIGLGALGMVVPATHPGRLLTHAAAGGLQGRLYALGTEATGRWSLGVKKPGAPSPAPPAQPSATQP